MKKLKALLLRCKEDLARRDLERLLEDFQKIQAFPWEELSLTEAQQALALLEELVQEAEHLKKDCENGLSGLAELERRLPVFFQQLRYLLLKFK